MAKIHGKDAKVFLSGVDISGDLNTVHPKLETELKPYATFGVSGYKQFPGIGVDTVSFDALFDTDSSTARYIANSTFGATAVSTRGMIITFANTVGGEAMATGVVQLKTYQITDVVTDITRFTAEFVTENYPFDGCRLLTTGLQTVIASGQGAAIDNTASTNAGGAAYLQVMNVSTSAISLTARIETSPDNLTWTTTGTFATVCDGFISAERLSFASTIDRYVRAAWLTTSTATFALAFGRY